MSIEQIKVKQSTLLLPKINHHLSRLLNDDWFNIDFWREKKAITGHSSGRNITWFIGHKNDEWVLRHYYRGGLISRYVKDQYIFRGIEKTRCYKELALLEQMHQQGLPVPKPIAARVQQSQFSYRADILIEKIPHTKDLSQHLAQSPMTEAEWHSLGAMIAKFHQAGIYHADLNAHNILIDKNIMFWLIDFDRCENREPDLEWQKANLNRLKRSFVKETKLGHIHHFKDQQWHWLIYGYQHFSHTV